MTASSASSLVQIEVPSPSLPQPHHHRVHRQPSPIGAFRRSPPPPPVAAKNAIRLVHDRLRRQSYDVRVLANGSIGQVNNNNNGSGGGNGPVAGQLRAQRTASARLNPSFTSPSLASSLSSPATAKRRSSRVISFGFASAGFYVHRGPNDEEWLEEFEFECERPSTSNSNDEEDCCCDTPAEDEGFRPASQHSSNTASQQHYRSRPPAAGQQQMTNGVMQKNGKAQPMALFLIRHADHRILPVYCYRPQGTQADLFIESLSDKNREAIKRYLDKERPDDGECYLWVREDATMKTTVLSLKALENHFKSEHIRRVKWRHLSADKVSVYRYSLPVITTKFRLRVAHFLARHYRCCILGVWCLVILCISVGIVLSVVFGSAPGLKTNGTVPLQPTRSGGFMDDAMQMDNEQQLQPVGATGRARTAIRQSSGGGAVVGGGSIQRWFRRRRRR